MGNLLKIIISISLLFVIGCGTKEGPTPTRTWCNDGEYLYFDEDTGKIGCYPYRGVEWPQARLSND